MEKLIKKFQSLKKAIAFLKKAIDDTEALKNKEYEVHLQNSKIKSFEFCVDMLWKFVRIYLQRIEGIDLPAIPKPVLQHCLIAKLTNSKETEILLVMIDDRNRTSHRYSEEMADEISEKIDEYYELMNKLIKTLETNLEKIGEYESQLKLFKKKEQ